jgi:hypothetical protein
MNIKERKQTVLAMENLVRSVSNEEYIESWLMCGVPDGDLNRNSIWDDVDDYFIDDNNFAELMQLFLKIMSRAYKDGGLYIDKVSSKE